MNVDLFLALPYLSCCELLCFTFKFYHLEKLETRKKCWIPELCWEIPETFSLSSLHPLAPRGTYWPTDCLICWFSTTLNQKKTANKFANELRIVLKLEKFIATFLSPPNLPDTANTSNCLWREDWPFPYLTVIESVENSWETDWLTDCALLQRPAVVTTFSWPTKVLPGQYRAQWGGGHGQERLPRASPPGPTTVTGNQWLFN